MDWREATDAIHSARKTVGEGDRVIRELSLLCCGRLRWANVVPDVLSALKRELRAWDIHRTCWKD
jgi:hypothetical protein